jgi:hypothetical protein
MEICKICNSQSIEIYSTKMLNKYEVKYFKCLKCDFIQTEKPFWLDEAYSNAITKQDIGLLHRNIKFFKITSSIIKILFNKNNRFLDYGGGYGVFVRIMRDAGFNFNRFDTYCENIFSMGYDFEKNVKYELITAFEVFEHLENPIEELSKMLGISNSIFFSTEVHNGKFDKDWWYLMPETGQHISLYSINSLKQMADKFELNFYSNGSTFHLFTKKKIPTIIFNIASDRFILKLINRIVKNPPSLLMSDYLRVINHNKS